jgi:hypothetical protein
MKKFFLIVMIAFLASCNDAVKVQTGLDTLGSKIDTLAKKVEDSKLVDSIKSKGGRLLDSTKSKGGRLIKGIDHKLSDLKNKKDSSK